MNARGQHGPWVPLSPLGTARQRLEPNAALSPALVAALTDADLGAEVQAFVWQVASWADGVTAEERHALAALVGRTMIALAAGSTRVPVSATDLALIERVPALVGGPGDRKPFVLANRYLYHQKLLACEDRLADAVRARVGRPGAFATEAISEAVATVAQSATPRPSEEQQAAVATALGRRFAVVTGGPGTGKTTIALTFLRALVRLGIPPEALALAAPTGKAANRLDEAIRTGLAALATPTAEDRDLAAGCPPAETLHRLLGYSPSIGRFAHHANNRLAARAVLVDEGSMIDLQLMEHLVRALADDAVLVLLGDADQLPSIRAGAAFRDLATLGVRLSQSYRMDPERSEGRNILETARAVNAGDAEALALTITERPNAKALAFAGVECVPPTEREALLERWYTERIASTPELEPIVARALDVADRHFTVAEGERLTALHDHHQRFRVLCLTREGPTGVRRTNAWMHHRHGATGAAPTAGEPIMMLRNDYDRGLWNGDQGLVMRVRSADRGVHLVAAFLIRGGWTAFDLDGLGDAIELSHAMTVHKAQGSEYDEVALLLPEAPLPIATREVIYTALTRSRRAVVVCGTPAVLAAAVNNPLARSSGLGEKLAVESGGDATRT